MRPARPARVLVAAALACLLSAIPAGCGKRSETEQPSAIGSTLKTIGGAPAALAVAEPMRPFFAAGLGFIVLGGLTLCLGAKGTGASLLALGVATTGTGVLFVQYPWAVLFLALAAGCVAVYAVYERIAARRELSRNRDALAATAEVIQKLPEGGAIKRGLSALGREVEEKVRLAVSPIKERLRREGKIES